MLLYLTKSFDPKDTSKILENRDSKVKFKQLRWFDIFQIANVYKKHLVINQMLEFMEDHKISSTNQLFPSRHHSFVKFFPSKEYDR